MKKAATRVEEHDEMLPEYDLSKLKSLGRGRYAAKMSGIVRYVPLEPDVAKGFPTSKAVNDALRSLLGQKKSAAKSAGKDAGGVGKTKRPTKAISK